MRPNFLGFEEHPPEADLTQIRGNLGRFHSFATDQLLFGQPLRVYPPFCIPGTDSILGTRDRLLTLPAPTTNFTDLLLPHSINSNETHRHCVPDTAPIKHQLSLPPANSLELTIPVC